MNIADRCRRCNYQKMFSGAGRLCQSVPPYHVHYNKPIDTAYKRVMPGRLSAPLQVNHMKHAARCRRCNYQKVVSGGVFHHITFITLLQNIQDRRCCL
jgi:hypothetical protein